MPKEAKSVKIEDTPSGPVAHVPPDEHLDLTEEAPEVDPDRVGSTARSDPEPALVNTSAEEDVKTEGDKLKPGYVSEVDKPPEVLPTAGELRKAGGYVVDDKVKASDIPSAYEADTPTPPGEVHLVRKPEEDEDAHLTPNERIAKGSKAKAVAKAPKNK